MEHVDPPDLLTQINQLIIEYNEKNKDDDFKLTIMKCKKNKRPRPKTKTDEEKLLTRLNYFITRNENETDQTKKHYNDCQIKHYKSKLSKCKP